MDKKNIFSINFKKYRKYCQDNSIPVPAWMTHIHFNEVIKRMEYEIQGFSACKYLCDLSKENKTRATDRVETGYTGFDFGLKWSKQMVVEVIAKFLVKEPLVKPIIPNNLVTTDEVKVAIAPFVSMAQRVLSSTLVRNFIEVEISAHDLRKIVELHDKMEASSNWNS